MSNHDNQIPVIYDQAIKRYKKITNKELNDVEFLKKIRNVEDLIKEVDEKNKAFANFRKKRQIFFEVLRGAMKPLELFGNITAGGACTLFPPSSFVFGAVILLINAAKGTTASYDAIQDLMMTLKVWQFAIEI